MFQEGNYPSLLYVKKINGATGESEGNMSLNVKTQREDVKNEWRKFFSKTSWYTISPNQTKHYIKGNKADSVYYEISEAIDKDNNRTIIVDERFKHSGILGPEKIAVDFARYILRED